MGDAVCTPTVADGYVYVTGNPHASTSNIGPLYCLNASTGKSIWSYSTGGSTGTVTDSSPAVVNGLLYVGGSGGDLYCLNASTGGFVWSYATGGPVGSSPAVVNGSVYFCSEDYNVYCLNASNGELIWSYRTISQFDSSPAVASGIVYAGSGDYIYALNSSSGALIWSFTSHSGGRSISSPAVAYGDVYASSYDGNVYCLNAASGNLIWSATGGYGVGSPAVAGGYVYSVYNYSVYCFAASNGASVWQCTTKGTIYSSPAVANGAVYVGSIDEHLYCLGQTAYSVMINAYDYTQGAFVNVPIAMDGSSTGQETPYTFSGLTSSHTFAVPSTDSNGNPFLDWSNDQTTTTITVSPADGTYTAYYQAATPALSASASATPTSGNAPLSVQFTGSASGGQSPYSYSWSFGDGSSPVSQQNPSHTYQSAGSYTATLTVMDSAASLRTSSVMITVGMSSTYTLTFTESGLPLSYDWAVTVTFNGVPDTTSSTTSSIVFPNVPKGVYAFSVTSVAYTASLPSGTVNVNGAGIVEVIAFSPIKSLKGISSTIIGAKSLMCDRPGLPGFPCRFSIQQNFYLFSGNKDAQGNPIVYWCQNTVDLQFYTSGVEVQYSYLEIFMDNTAT
jgi:outer membrane protein assembly factor BamB/PKD repeat protein